MSTIAEDFTYQFPPKTVENTDRVVVYDKDNKIRIVDNAHLPDGITGTYVLGDYNVTFVNGIATEITSVL
ncbi:MAG: hypothetical protein EA392_00370 [Cryomorphaceae bacterium]|nr:MAG: hypothetical protein EA392_00370 [Cryomorphaceae bacterium]